MSITSILVLRHIISAVLSWVGKLMFYHSTNPFQVKLMHLEDMIQKNEALRAGVNHVFETLGL